MRYQCVHCDHVFELAPEAEQNRCPNCLRQNGLRPVDGAEKKAGPTQPSGSRSRLPLAIGALVLLAGGGGYFFYTQRMAVPTDPAVIARAPLASHARDELLKARGVTGDPLARLLEADDAVERFAEKAAGSKTSAEDKAAAIVLALKARATAQAFVPWSMADPQTDLPHTAAETLAAIGKDGARQELYPLELTALGVAALRALDVPAMVAEVKGVQGERTPLDASGRFGYFAIAIPSPKGEQLFDPYGGRAPFQVQSHALLSDLEAIGAALSLRACARLARNEDPSAALRDADAAIKLLPSSASVRSTRGTVLMANAATDLGAAELQAAAQISPDAARKNNLAMLNLVQGDGEGAARAVSQALAEYPDFALAHVTLAAVHLSAGERDQARVALEKAEALDPALPSLAMTWAQFHASAGQVAQALNYAERAVKERPKDPQAHLLLAGLYRQAARYDAMREHAREVMKLTPPQTEGRMRELIARLLGPTALERAPAADEDTDDTAAAAPSAADTPAADTASTGRLELKAPGSSGSHLRLLDGEPGAPSSGTLKGPDGAPKLRLQGKGLSLGSP